MYIILPEDKQVKRHLIKEIHARQEKGQLNFQVQIEIEICSNIMLYFKHSLPYTPKYYIHSVEFRFLQTLDL